MKPAEAQESQQLEAIAVSAFPAVVVLPRWHSWPIHRELDLGRRLFLIAIALLRLLEEFRGTMLLVIAGALTGVSAYLAFLVSIDVPTYLGRWQADLAAGKEHLGGLTGASTTSPHVGA